MVLFLSIISVVVLVLFLLLSFTWCIIWSSLSYVWSFYDFVIFTVLLLCSSLGLLVRNEFPPTTTRVIPRVDPKRYPPLTPDIVTGSRKLTKGLSAFPEKRFALWPSTSGWDFRSGNAALAFLLHAESPVKDRLKNISLSVSQRYVKSGIHKSPSRSRWEHICLRTIGLREKRSRFNANNGVAERGSTDYR